VGLAAGPVTAYWNPAGLAFSRGRHAAAMHSERFNGIVSFDYLGFSSSDGGRSGWAVSLVRLGIDQIPDTRNLQIADWGTDGLPDESEPGYDPVANPDPSGDDFSPENPTGTEGNGRLDSGERVYYDEDRLIWLSDAETALFLSWATGGGRFSWGFNVKLFRKAVGRYSGNGLGVDLACLYKVRDYLAIGANLQDAATSILVWRNGTREVIPPHLKAGFCFRPRLPVFEKKLTFLLDFDVHGEGRRTADRFSLGRFSAIEHVGIEYLLHRRVALRWGENAGSITAGAGLSFGRFRVDYAFGTHHDLGDTHRVSGAVRL